MPTPSAILVISAHWEARAFTVMKSPSPPMYYDYGGFPKKAYEVSYPAPGSPALADRVISLLTSAGLDTASDAKRGYDHGVFVPFLLM